VERTPEEFQLVVRSGVVRDSRGDFTTRDFLPFFGAGSCPLDARSSDGQHTMNHETRLSIDMRVD
jgi:hypothetical protein